jgi:hypothetical protein
MCSPQALKHAATVEFAHFAEVAALQTLQHTIKVWGSRRSVGCLFHTEYLNRILIIQRYTTMNARRMSRKE